MLGPVQIKAIKNTIQDGEEQFPLIFAALGETGRFRIFRLLMKHQGLCVTDIANILGITVPAASQQLKILEMSGLIRKERRGQMTCYEIRDSDPVIKSIIKIFS